jgi:ABC-2 type transport system permease protein
MISNTFVAPSLMPGWLGTLAEWNPLSATRELFGNSVPELVGTSWPAQNTLLLAVVWPVLIVAVFLQLAVRRYHATAG